MKKNILLSFPRSGNHLVRFIIEILTEKPTKGHINNSRDIPIYKNIFSKNVNFNIKDENDYIYHKYHGRELLKDNCEWGDFILIIRNPKEVILRHCNFDLVKLLKCNFIRTYFENIERFLNYNGRKKIFYYEDMITNKKEFVKELYDFLEIKKENKLKYLLNNTDELFKLNLNPKGRAWGNNISKCNINFYYPQIDKYNRNNFNNNIKKYYNNNKFKFLKDKYGDLFYI